METQIEYGPLPKKYHPIQIYLRGVYFVEMRCTLYNNISHLPEGWEIHET